MAWTQATGSIHYETSDSRVAPSDSIGRVIVKTGCNDGGTSHAVLSPMGFVKLVSVPKPSVNLTRAHGVFPPGSKLRAYVLQRKRIREAGGIALPLGKGLFDDGRYFSRSRE